jgi:hypothetical protein
MVPPTPLPVHLVVATPLPVHIADAANILITVVFPSISTAAAVVAAYYAVRTGRAALKALRRPQLVITPSYRSSDGGNYQVALTANGDAAIAFEISNLELGPATNVKVRLKIEGFERAAMGSIPLGHS